MSQHTPDAWIERNVDDPGDPYFEGEEPDEQLENQTTESTAYPTTESEQNNMNYVYIQSERAGQKISPGNYLEHDLYTVGFYEPDGKWQPESDFSTREEAAQRVHYLNGGK